MHGIDKSQTRHFMIEKVCHEQKITLVYILSDS